MMSSEEDSDSFGLYVDKLLKKHKRARQRVDAGEPRNSYSSIPNFSSRPSFMSGGLYGAIFSQSQQHFGGLFGPGGYGPANKMLNELLGRQVKQAQDATDPDSIMLSSIEAANAADSNTPISKHGFESSTNLNNNNNNSSTNNNNNSANNNSPTSDGSVTMMGRRRSNSQNNTANSGNNNSNSNSSGVIDLDGGSRTPQPNDLAHHMLRNILQGKKELMALDHELRTVSNQSSALGDRISPDNNNVISKNNNIYDITKCESVNGGSGDVSDSSDLGAHNNSASTKVNHKNSATNNQTNNSDNSQSNRPISLNSNANNCDDLLASELAHTERLLNGGINSSSTGGSGGRCSSINPKQEKTDVIDELVASLPDETDETMPSPGSGSNGVVITKQELDIDDCLEDKDRNGRTPSPVQSKNDSESLTLKRARVENIVSSLRVSPALLSSQPGQVNGCKKRKLYHPQQHDNSAAERYAAAAAAGLNLGLTLQNFMLGASVEPDDDDDDMEITPHIHQKRVEKDVLKSQLRSMQEQLAEMQQKYVQLCSRMEQQSDTQEVDDSVSDIMEDDSNPDLTPDKSLMQSSPASTPIKDVGKNADASSMLQMMSKMMSAKIHNQLPTHPHLQTGFNGTHLFLQHMQQAGLPHDGMSQHNQMSNAAMYQKLFMEQEARMVKEVAEQQERNLQNSNQQLLQQQALQQQQQHQHQQQQQQQMQHQQQQQQERNMQNTNQQLMQQQVQPQNQASQPQLQSPPHQSNQSQHQQQQQQQQQHMQLQQQQQQQQQQMQQQQPSQTSHISPPQMPQLPHMPLIPKGSTIPSDLTSRLNLMRSSNSSVGQMSGTDLEGLADVLKTEITASLSNLVDSIVTRFVHQRRFLGKQSEAAAAAAEQLNKDLMMASQLLDRAKSPRTKVSSDRGANVNNSSSNLSGNGPMLNSSSLNSAPNPNVVNQPSAGNPMMSGPQGNGPRLNGTAFPPMGMPMHVNNVPPHDSKNNLNQINMPPHVRPSPSTAMFQTPKPPQNLNSVAAAALYNSMNALGNSQVNPFCMPEPRENPEQAEALSLVVTPKKKRHKVTDTRITPRTVSRILAQDGIIPSGNPIQIEQNNSNQGSNNSNNNGLNNSGNSGNNNNISNNINNNNNNISKNNNPQQQFNSQPPSVQASTPTESPSPRGSYHQPPPSMLPVSLPTSVAIPNPSLHESQVFSPYSPFFNPHGPPHGGPHGPQPSQFHHMKVSSSPPGINGLMDPRDSPPLPHPPTMLHPALLAAAHHGNSPDYGHIRASMDVNDRNSDCNSVNDISYNGMEPTSSTLTPMHLRKAKLMFFWVRYPSSAVLKMYFPDIKFNKNNTAQLVKWFSNFREFYYIQMEKYARQAVSEGMKNVDDIHVSNDSEIYRVLNLHYNRNNHIEVPQNFRYVIEQTLREFFRAIQGGKDTEQSWKKSIYKIISRMDDPVPEYFKTPNFLEQLE
ncbi:homeobox protein prospero-like isoform X2 [Topomyia yanbarensis]|uniref:homeobox protein prospero-like isoform X2 n=1 Tax=Topomyia yanbarensis TaxID=2498891 RepID=UPI00273C53E1|nr:homeobox protein prospero-like isoform X2 [Topomyia yanbarensis]